jgi:ABC-type nitrate/sulfonate/bicarbonate transport system substrate-binding protein
VVDLSRRQVGKIFAAGAMLSSGSFALMETSRADTPVQKATVAVGGQGLVFIVLYTGVDAGFFRQQGLDITILDVGSGTRQAAAIMGGSAEMSTVGFEQNMQADARGGSLVAVCSCFNAFPMNITLSRKAADKNGFKPGLSLDDKIKRLHGLRLGISSPGSSTEQFVRTLFLARGMNPETEVSLQPVGGGAPMLAALEAGSIDGFVWMPPFSTAAVAKDNAEIVIDAMTGEVPEFTNYAYMGLSTSRQTLDSKRPVLLSAVRAFAATIKFIHADPDKAAAVIRHRFPEMDDDQYRKAFDLFVKGVPTTPEIEEARYNKTLATLNISLKPPLAVSYSQVVMPALAQEVMKG